MPKHRIPIDITKANLEYLRRVKEAHRISFTLQINLLIEQMRKKDDIKVISNALHPSDSK